MVWQLRTEHATVASDGRWTPGPKLQELLDSGWEPFAVSEMDGANNQLLAGKVNCPLVWLRRQVDNDTKLDLPR